MFLQASGDLKAKVEEVERSLRFDLRHVFPSLASLAAFEGDKDDDDKDDLDEEDDKDLDDDKDDKSKVKDPERKALSEEAKRYRLRAREERRQREAAEAKLREREDKDKDVGERLQSQLDELNAKVQKYEPLVKEQAVKIAFFESGAAAQFRDPAVAIKLLDLSDIDVDDDGVVDTDDIKQRAEDLLKKSSYLAASGGADEDEEEDKKDELPSGRQTNGKKDKSQVDYEALANRFPALRR